MSVDFKFNSSKPPQKGDVVAGFDGVKNTFALDKSSLGVFAASADGLSQREPGFELTADI